MNPSEQMSRLLEEIGDEVLDHEEELFSLVALRHGNQDLGMLDPEADTVDVRLAGKDLSLQQSPGVLHSRRTEGTTGAAIWRTSLHMATWLASSQSPLPMICKQVHSTTAVELGCGVSPLLAFSLYGKVARYVATDQAYVLSRFGENVNTNMSLYTKQARQRPRQTTHETQTIIETSHLDWETHDVPRQLRQHLSATAGTSDDVSLVLACDCIFNESLVEPFVQTCMTICKMEKGSNPNVHTLCVIGQQLRSPDVLGLWISSMMRHFRLFQVKPEYLTGDLKEPSAFVIHLAVLKA